MSTITLENSPVTIREMMDFLLSRPTLEMVIAYKVSPKTQARLAEFLDKNREVGLTEMEMAELDSYEQLNFTLSLLKAHARLALLNLN